MSLTRLLLRKSGGRVDAPGRGLGGTEGEYAFMVFRVDADSCGNWKPTGRFVVAALGLCAAVAHGGQPQPAGTAAEALALCEQADQLSSAERWAVLARGLAHAEEAVRVNPQDAVAHFAVFCNLGSAWR